MTPEIKRAAAIMGKPRDLRETVYQHRERCRLQFFHDGLCSVRRVRPILFSPPMILAILQGRKTQTRRIAPGALATLTGPADAISSLRIIWDAPNPYGTAGDRLWPREAWRMPASLDPFSPEEVGKKAVAAGYSKPWAPIIYLADNATLNWDATSPQWGDPGRYRHARFMPRWASRIVLEIQDHRIEMLHDITTRDALDEGIPQTAGEAHVLGLYDMSEEPGHEWDNRTSVENYARLWDKINGPGAWAANPAVHVLTFSVLEVKR